MIRGWLNWDERSWSWQLCMRMREGIQFGWGCTVMGCEEEEMNELQGDWGVMNAYIVGWNGTCVLCRECHSSSIMVRLDECGMWPRELWEWKSTKGCEVVEITCIYFSWFQGIVLLESAWIINRTAVNSLYTIDFELGLYQNYSWTKEHTACQWVS